MRDNLFFRYEGADTAHKNWWQTFEVIFGIPFLVAIALQFTMPLSFPQELSSPAVITGGVVLIIAGMVLVILARREFNQYDQPTDPGRPTSKLVTTGIFSISRNPLYLGGTCVIVGISLTFDLSWALIFLGPSII